MKDKKDPLRIILDSQLRIPQESQVLRDNNVLIVSTRKGDKAKLKKLRERNIDVLIFDTDKISLPDLLAELAQKEIISLLVEGGGETISNFFDQQLVDKVYAFYAPIIIGGKESIPAIRGKEVESIKEAMYLKSVVFKRFTDNFLLIGYPS